MVPSVAESFRWYRNQVSRALPIRQQGPLLAPPPSIGPSAALAPGTSPEQPGKREQPVSPSALRPDLVTDCDRLAAHPSDEQRPPDVAGVFEHEIDIVAALRACS